MQPVTLLKSAGQLAAATAAVALLGSCTAPTKKVAQNLIKGPFFSAQLSDKLPKLAFLQYFNAAEPSCLQQLRHSAAVYISLPDLRTPHGCGYKNAVLVLMVGNTSLTSPTILQCKTALHLTRWVTRDVQPAAQTLLGTTVSKIKVSDHYSCRLKGGRRLVEKPGRRVHKPARSRMSQHAFANAVDVSRIWFANGQESRVMLDWHGPMRSARVQKGVLKMPAKTEKQVRQGVLVAFWRTVAKRACGRFTKVLTPEYNWMHRHHIHLDLSPGKRCTLDGTVAGGHRYKRSRRWTKHRYARARYKSSRYKRSRYKRSRYKRSRYTASTWRRIRARNAAKKRAAKRRAVYVRVHKRRIRARHAAKRRAAKRRAVYVRVHKRRIRRR